MNYTMSFWINDKKITPNQKNNTYQTEFEQKDLFLAGIDKTDNISFIEIESDFSVEFISGQEEYCMKEWKCDLLKRKGNETKLYKYQNIIEPVEISDKEKLIEIIKFLYPEYKDVYFHSGKGDGDSCEHIGLGFQHPEKEYWIDFKYIHWFELCLYHISPKLHQMVDDMHSSEIAWSNFLQADDKVGFLYKKFKKLKP